MAPPRTGKFTKKHGKEIKKLLRTTDDKKFVLALSLFFDKSLEQANRDSGITPNAMSMLCSYDNNLFNPISAESFRLAQNNKRLIITSRIVKMAFRRMLPDELAKQAISEGIKAINNRKYNSRK